ncbi:MAG TPA: hypothetical protein VN903_02415 [Polyangia bacterium]|jgi:hypothetical protein|nr:hypothetical protein [Polyangia bacterium]
MTRGALKWCAALLLASAGFYGACDDTIVGKDCKVKCDDADNVCVQKCNDDQCKTVCKTDLDNCRASCDSVTVMPPSSDGGR